MLIYYINPPKTTAYKYVYANYNFSPATLSYLFDSLQKIDFLCHFQG